MIKTIALNMAKNIATTIDSQENIEVYAYSLQLIFISLINMILVVLAAFLLEIIPTTLAFLVVFIPFRAFGGGVHLSTIPRCIIIGSSLMLGSAYIAAQKNFEPYCLGILFAFTTLTLIWVMKWVPAGIEKPLINPKLVRMQKRNMLLSVIGWIICVNACIHFNQTSLALVMILGGLISAVLISPLGFNMMGFIDRFLNIMEGGLSIHDE